MDWVKGVQHAIDYLESHMTEDLKVEEDYLELQRQIISQWLPTSGYMLSDRPQINRVVMDPEPGKRYMEIWMPIE